MQFEQLVEAIHSVQPDNDGGYNITLTHREWGYMVYRAIDDDDTELGQCLWAKCQSLGLTPLPQAIQAAAHAARAARNARLHELNDVAGLVAKHKGPEAYQAFEDEVEDYRAELAQLPYNAAWPQIDTWPERPTIVAAKADAMAAAEAALNESDDDEAAEEDND